MTKKIDYPAIKKALWEAWRTFLPSFLGVVTIQLSTGAGSQDVSAWLKSILVASVLAGLKATAKWYRETYGNKDYDSLVYKLPV